MKNNDLFDPKCRFIAVASQ